MSNLLFIEPNLNDLSIFLGSLNSNTNGIIYNPEIPYHPISGINHIGFVYHYLGYPRFPFFDEREYIDENGILQYSNLFFSQTFKNFLTQMKNRNPELKIDLLTCNVFDSEFIRQVNELSQEIGIEIRYSSNNIGNLKNADWIQESHNIDIKNIYFNQNVINWKHNLNTGIPIENLSSIFLQDGNTFYLKTDTSWNTNIPGVNAITDYIILKANQVMDGNGFTLHYPIGDLSGVNSYFGFFSTNDATVDDFTKAPLVKNINISWVDSSTNAVGGILSYWGGIIRREQKFFKVDNCIATGTIAGQCGGISGFQSGIGGGNFHITNCRFNGNIGFSINSQGAGGICAGNSVGTDVKILNCVSNGTMVGHYSGGIVGARLGRNFSNFLIDSCYYLGAIADYGGGIAGSETGRGANSLIISNCYSTGNIGTYGGGVSGHDTSQKVAAEENTANCQIINCYAFGTVGTAAGAMMGRSSTTTASNYGTRVVSRCVGRTRMFGTNTTGTQTSNSTSLSTIVNQIYTGWSTDKWISTTSNYPRLVSFTVSPFSSYNLHSTIATLSFTRINTKPDPPTITSITNSNSLVIINFTAPTYTGHTSITNYSIVSPNISSLNSPFLVNGLTVDTSYTFSLVATNSVGSSSTVSTSIFTASSTLNNNDTAGNLSSFLTNYSGLSTNNKKTFLMSLLNSDKTNRFFTLQNQYVNELTNQNTYVDSGKNIKVMIPDSSGIDITSEIVGSTLYIPVKTDESISFILKNRSYLIENIGGDIYFDSSLVNQLGLIRGNVKVVMIGGLGIEYNESVGVGAIGSDPFMLSLNGNRQHLPQSNDWLKLFDNESDLKLFAHTTVLENSCIINNVHIRFSNISFTIDYDIRSIKQTGSSSDVAKGKLNYTFNFKLGETSIIENLDVDAIKIIHNLYGEVLFLFHWERKYLLVIFKEKPSSGIGIFMD